MTSPRIGEVFSTVVLLLLIAVAVLFVMNFLTAPDPGLQMSRAYWIVPIFGALGGIVGAILRGDRKLQVVSMVDPQTIGMGIVGDVILGLGGSAAAVFLFGGTLRFVPNDPDSYILLISVSLVAGVFGRNFLITAGHRLSDLVRREAKEEAASVVARPTAVTYALAAQRRISQGKFEEALDEAGNAINADPSYVTGYIEKARALHRLKKTEEALAVIDGVLKVHHDHAKALYNRACYRNVLGQSKESVLGDLVKAFSERPELKRVAESDDDLKTLHSSDEFKKLLA